MERAKGGFRKDLKHFFRSGMEANIARYYNVVKVKWLYESKEFEFKTIKRGNRYYKPDFYLPKDGIWVEVKGWFRRSDKIKLRRFKRYYPEEFTKLWFIIPDKYSKSKSNGKIMNFLLDDLKIKFNDIIGYEEIEKWRKLIPNWE